MDISDIRRENLKRLILDSGSRQRFIEISGKSDAQISQLLSTNKNSRNIGGRLAREIEQAFSKPPGWMDRDNTVNVFDLMRRHRAQKVRQYTGDKSLSDDEAIEIFDAQYDDYSGKPTPSELLPTAEDELIMAGPLDAWDNGTHLAPDEVELPLFREVELAAGHGATQVIENHGAKLRFARSTLRKAGVLPENAACAYVRGNSMDPMMPDGSCIGINTADTEIRDGKIYAIDHDGMLRVKILHRRPGGGLKIVSLNALEHPNEEYSADYVAQNIQIKGRVFWYSGLL